jgi:hypothetical protein
MKKFLAVLALFTVVGVAWAVAGKYTNSMGALVVNSGEAIVTHLQPATLQNAESVSAVNTAVTKSIAAAVGQSVQLYAVSARCSAGTAGLTIKDGVAGTTVWTTGAAASTNLTFYTPLSSTAGNGMDVTLAACGTSNTGTLDVQASQF